VLGASMFAVATLFGRVALSDLGMETLRREAAGWLIRGIL
jgi:hypothetical protein